MAGRSKKRTASNKKSSQPPAKKQTTGSVKPEPKKAADKSKGKQPKHESSDNDEEPDEDLDEDDFVDEDEEITIWYDGLLTSLDDISKEPIRVLKARSEAEIQNDPNLRVVRDFQNLFAAVERQRRGF